jgi:hypothetical protein
LDQAIERLGGNCRAAAIELQRAEKDFEENAQIPVPDSEADEQEALANALEHAQEAIGKRRPLRNDPDQKVENVIFAEHERGWFFGAPKEMEDDGRSRSTGQHKLGVFSLVATQMIAVRDGRFSRRFKSLLQHGVLASGHDERKRKRCQLLMHRGRTILTRRQDHLRRGAESGGPESLCVFILLGKGRQSVPAG